MRKLSDEFVERTGNTIWAQIKATTPPDIIGSWGISELYSQEIVVKGLHHAALVMKVQGFQFTGYTIIALDEAQDLYKIYTAINKEVEFDERFTEVYCDSLSACLDHVIEKGAMSEEEYNEKVRAMLFG